MSAVTVKHYAAPPLNRAEIWRYAGVKEPTAELEALLADCIKQAEGKLSYRVCAVEEKTLPFGNEHFASLEEHLRGCESVILFAATVGGELDRLIAREQLLSPAKAVLLSAIGAERVEALCDAFCADVEAEAKHRGLYPRSRFSPGYGDLPLRLQKNVFRTLDLTRRLGMTLNESLLMYPTKSVTAIIGLGREKDGTASCAHHCASCERKTCIFNEK